MSSKNFFPKYLNKGSKGPAVALLQIILLVRGHNRYIVTDGDYGDETAKGVRQLQKILRVEQDGHFGPQTRQALFAETELNVGAIPADIFGGENQAVAP